MQYICVQYNAFVCQEKKSFQQQRLTIKENYYADKIIHGPLKSESVRTITMRQYKCEDIA